MEKLSQLRIAIATHLGKMLSPEVAASIEVMALSRPDLSHDPLKFGSVERHCMVFQAERLRDILEEIKPLHEEHWLETEKHRHGLPLKPDYEEMLRRELAGELFQFTVRKGGKLVGNLRVYVRASMHTGTTFAEEDTLYLSPEVRGGLAALTLIRFMEDSLRSIGVREFRANSKLINKADVLMRRMKYEPVALQFVKIC